MLVDYAKIFVKAGKGGDGMVSFHREKYVTNGGPDGGDGGKGGDVIFCAVEDISTLQGFRYKRKYVAADGDKGMGHKMYGRGGENLKIKVPVGTLITNADTGKVIADFTEPGQEVVAAKGGKGGPGNMHFANSVRQAPNFARAGISGEEYNLIVELKLIADVGLVGFPNVGKSTILSKVSSAQPKVANYHFTTIDPMLGVVSIDLDTSFVLADIPGIIEGAHEGVGLGHYFLRHVERTRLLIHVVDISGCEGRNPIDDFDKINSELEQYSPFLKDKPQVVVANKIDQASDEQINEFKCEMESRGYVVFEVCAATGQGLKDVMKKVAENLSKLPMPAPFVETEEEKTYKYEAEDLFKVSRDNEWYVVTGSWIENLVESTNFDDFDSLSYFQRIIRKKGVIDALKSAGIKEGDPVKMYELEFDYVE